MDAAPDVPGFLVQQGVYNGWTLLCLRCKAMTYVPNRVGLDEYIADRIYVHPAYCAAALADLLAGLR